MSLRENLGGKWSALAVLGTLGLASGGSAVRGQDATPPAVLKVQAETRRRYLLISVEGSLPKGAHALATRVRRGDAVALERPVSAEGGDLKLELLVTGRLLPDAYTLEVVGVGSQVLARGPLQVGTAAEKDLAQERLRGWLRNQRYRLRNLEAALECHGRYRFAELDQGASGGRPPAVLADAKREALAGAFADLEGRIRAARMDFSQYEREVVLTPYPQATKIILELFELLSARKKELAAAVDAAAAGQATARPVISPAILDAAKRSAVALELPPDGPDSDLWAWDPGPIALPEVVSVTGSSVSSPLGYTINLPEGWTVADVRTSSRDDPLERLHLVGPSSARAIIRVSDQPDMPSWSALASELGAQALEEFGNQAYQILKSGDFDNGTGFRVDATIASGDKTRRIVLASRGPASGKRLWQLLVDAPALEWDALEPGVETLASSFAVDWTREQKGR